MLDIDYEIGSSYQCNTSSFAFFIFGLIFDLQVCDIQFSLGLFLHNDSFMMIPLGISALLLFYKCYNLHFHCSNFSVCSRIKICCYSNIPFSSIFCSLWSEQHFHIWWHWSFNYSFSYHVSSRSLFVR